METLIFGPADMSASLGLPTVTAGLPMPGYPGDHWHWVLETILVAARDAGLQAIDGPYLLIKDLDGFREMAMRARALGYDGKWALHPGQIDVLNEVFTPTQEEYDKAEALLEAYKHATEVERTGAVMFGNEMIDEASRKMAVQFAERGRAAGMSVQKKLEDFQAEWSRLTMIELNDTQKAIVETVREFVEKEVYPVAEELEHKDEFPETIVEQMKEMGLFGITVPGGVRRASGSR